MKDIYEVLRKKQHERDLVAREVQALKLVVAMLQHESQDEVQPETKNVVRPEPRPWP